MLAAKRLAGVTPEMNLKESIAHSEWGGPPLALKPKGRCYQKSKTGLSVAPQKVLMSSKI